MGRAIAFVLVWLGIAVFCCAWWLVALHCAFNGKVFV